MARDICSGAPYSPPPLFFPPLFSVLAHPPLFALVFALLRPLHIERETKGRERAFACKRMHDAQYTAVEHFAPLVPGLSSAPVLHCDADADVNAEAGG